MRDVPDNEYRNYVDNNIVAHELLVYLAKKIIHGIRLATKEKAIFQGRTTEINNIIIQLKNQKRRR